MHDTPHIHQLRNRHGDGVAMDMFAETLAKSIPCCKIKAGDIVFVKTRVGTRLKAKVLGFDFEAVAPRFAHLAPAPVHVYFGNGTAWWAGHSLADVYPMSILSHLHT